MKTAVIHRIRKRIDATVYPETREFQKTKFLNAVRLLDIAVYELQTKAKGESILLYQNWQKNGLAEIRAQGPLRVKKNVRIAGQKRSAQFS